MREPFGDVLQRRQAVAESSFLLEKIGICVQLDSGVQKLTAPPLEYVHGWLMCGSTVPGQNSKNLFPKSHR